jgi:hypothetical protein
LIYIINKMMSYLQTFPGFLVLMAVVCLLFSQFEKRICSSLGPGNKETCETVGDYAVPAATFSGCVALMCLFMSMMGMGHMMGGMGMGGMGGGMMGGYGGGYGGGMYGY